MKRIPVYVLTILMTSVLLLSCGRIQNKKSTDKTEEARNPMPNFNGENDQPGPNWKLVWSDEFDADTINTNNWNFQVLKAGQFNDEWQRYTNSSENAYIENGNLVIAAIHESESHGLDQYTSARLNTANKQAWKYGKIVARIKLPEGQGIWPAFWMLGANIDENGGDTPWPQCGEIDILELYGSRDDAVVEANIHFADKRGRHDMMGAVPYKLEEGKFSDAFHIFELDWDEDRMKWFVDGEEFASKSITADELTEFHEKFFILLNIAVGGTHAGYPDSTTGFPQKMYVDWIRVYQKQG